MIPPACNDPVTAVHRAASRGEVVLDGLHALKHAWRFGARVTRAYSADLGALRDLAADLAPDLIAALDSLISEVPPEVFRALSPQPVATGVIAVAARPSLDVNALWRAPDEAPLVLLQKPRHLGNIGAVVRVAAAAGAAGVLTTGPVDPWQRAALRGAAGLHYALPVGRLAASTEDHETPLRGTAAASGEEYREVTPLPVTARPLLALHPDGTPLGLQPIPNGAILAFGTERDGLSADLLARADRVVTIPMRPKVSSLNLATAVAVTLYTWRLTKGG